MKYRDKLNSLLLVPKAIRHLLQIKSKLKNTSYSEIIKQSYTTRTSIKSVKIIVKSYFWGSRLVLNCKCLPRSIAIYQHLKSQGYDVQHKFGVNKFDKNLAAHAWVEYKEKPLNEAADLTRRFIVLEKPKL